MSDKQRTAVLRSKLGVQLPAEYQLVEVVSQPQPNCLGDISVMQHRDSYRVMKLLPSFASFGKEPAQEARLVEFYNLLGQTIPRVQPFLGFNQELDPDLLKGVFSYSPNTLSLLLHSHRTQKKPVAESILWTVIKDITRGGYNLEQIGVYSANINCDSVYHDGKQFLLVHPFLNEGVIAGWLAMPEQPSDALKMRLNNNVVQFGYMLLQLSSLYSDAELFNQSAGTTRVPIKEKARQAIQIMGSLYSPELNSFVLLLIKGRTLQGLMTFKDLVKVDPTILNDFTAKKASILGSGLVSNPAQENPGLMDALKHMFEKQPDQARPSKQIQEATGGRTQTLSQIKSQVREPQHSSQSRSKISELIAASDTNLIELNRDAQPSEASPDLAFQTQHEGPTNIKQSGRYPSTIPNGPIGPVKITATNLSINRAAENTFARNVGPVKAKAIDLSLRHRPSERLQLNTLPGPNRQEQPEFYTTQLSNVVPSYIPTLEEVSKQQEQEEDEHLNRTGSSAGYRPDEDGWESQLLAAKSKQSRTDKSFRQPAHISKYGDIETGENVYRLGFRNDITREDLNVGSETRQKIQNPTNRESQLRPQQPNKSVLSEVIKGERIYLQTLNPEKPILLDLSREISQHRGRSADPRVIHAQEKGPNYTKLKIFEDNKDEFGIPEDISRIEPRPVQMKRSGSLAGLILKDAQNSREEGRIPATTTTQTAKLISGNHESLRYQLSPPAATFRTPKGPGVIHFPTTSQYNPTAPYLPHFTMPQPVRSHQLVRPVGVTSPAAVPIPISIGLQRESVRPVSKEVWRNNYHPMHVVHSSPLKVFGVTHAIS